MNVSPFQTTEEEETILTKYAVKFAVSETRAMTEGNWDSSGPPEVEISKS